MNKSVAKLLSKVITNPGANDLVKKGFIGQPKIAAPLKVTK